MKLLYCITRLLYSLLVAEQLGCVQCTHKAHTQDKVRKKTDTEN